MITTLLFDFGRVVLLPKDRNFQGGLNSLYRKVSKRPDFKFDDYFELNQPLVDFLDSIKSRVDLFVFTFGSIQEAPEIAPTVQKIFKEVFSAEKLTLDKENPNSFLEITKRMGKDPSEIVFIDDKSVNVEAAMAVGIKAIQYKSFDQVSQGLHKEGVRGV